MDITPFLHALCAVAAQVMIGLFAGNWFNYFHRKQSDLLGSYSVSVPPNLFSTIYANVGTLRNTGFELDITVNAVRTKDLNCLGIKVDASEPHVLNIDSTEITSCEAPYELVRCMRASFLVMGPLLR